MLAAQLLPLSKTKARALRHLRDKKERVQQQAFLVEGSKQIQAFIEAGAPILQLIGTESFFETLSVLPSTDTPCYVATPATLEYLSNLVSPPAGMALVQLPQATPLHLKAGERGLALADVRNPNNLGTILRTACWYGIRKVICSTTTVDCYHPKSVQASMGALAHVQCYYTDLLTYFKTKKHPLLGASLAGKPLTQETFPKTGWLVIGNEGTGIPADILPLLTEQITIPKFGPMESLNAAAAAAVLCHTWASTVA